jgi:lipopolysaccharide export system protein LptA
MIDFRISRQTWLLGAALLLSIPYAHAQEVTPQAGAPAAAAKTSPAKARASAPASDAKKPANAKPAKKTSGKVAPADEPSTLILSDTLHYDDVKKQSIFTGNVILTRGLMTLHADHVETQQQPDGSQHGTATANPGKMVTIHQDRPETHELIEGVGLRAEYDDAKSQFDLIGQAVVTRFICGKPFDSIRGQRVRYNDKTGTYEAQGGPGSSAPGGRVRSIAEPRAKADAAIAACREPAVKAPVPKP